MNFILHLRPGTFVQARESRAMRPSSEHVIASNAGTRRCSSLALHPRDLHVFFKHPFDTSMDRILQGMVTMDIELTLLLMTRIIILLACGLLLVKSWMASNKRFLSDFPFVFALIFFAFMVGKMVDLYIQMNFGPQDTSPAFLAATRARYIVMAVYMVGLIGSVLLIWFKSKKRANLGILSGYAATFVAVALLAPDYQSLSMSLTYLVFPVIVILTFTFFFTHHLKRLRNKFNSLVVAIGCIITAISHVIRPSLIKMGTGGWGLSWICEVIDLVAWAFIFWGFFKPPVATRVVTEAARPIDT